MVYVDDLKLAGPNQNLKEGWDLIHSSEGANVKIDDPSPLGLCLGCDHHEFVRTYDGHKVRGIQYDMEGNLKLAVAHYQNLCQQYSYKSSLKHVDTPFIDEVPA